MIDFIAETLFIITGGAPVALTWWVLPYTIIFVLILLVQILIMNHFLEKKYVVVPLSMIITIPITFFVLFGGPLWQGNYMKDCYKSDAVVITDDGQRDAIVNNCRTRDNRYDDFGEFSFHSVTLK